MSAHKKIKKGPRIILLILILMNIIAYGYLSYGLYLLSGIETILRYAGIIILLIINFLIVAFAIKSVKKSRIGKFVFSLIILMIFIAIQGYVGYLINNVYTSISNMNKDNITYETYLIVYKNSNIKKISAIKNMKIAILNDKTSIDNYILAKDIIDKYSLDSNNTIQEYDDVSLMVSDLYNENVDAIFITSNYIELFSNQENYENIEEDTKIITKLSKSYTKNEINKIENNSDETTLKESKIEKPFTILVMGIDSTAETLNKNAVGNGDSIIIITFNPKTLNATILSIPRDMYVPISCSNNNERKINSAAIGGINCMKKTIENFLDITIDYYVKVNFKGVVNLVDVLGGIEVNVPYSFCEQNSARKWGDSTVYVEKGLQTLSGEQALALSRNRHAPADSKQMMKYCPTYTEGTRSDYVRGQNQQLVIQGVINKVKTINNPNQFLNILNAISNNMDTNFTTEQILSFYNIAKNMLKASTIGSDNVLSLDKLYMSGTTQEILDESSGLVLYMEIPNQSSVKAIKEAMAKNLSTTTALVKTFDFDVNEPYTTTVIGKNPANKTTLYSLLGDLTGKTTENAISYCNSKSITYEIQYEASSGISGIVIKQSYSQYKRIDKITNPIVLTVSIAN